MNEPNSQPDRFEELLARAQQLDQAGVFNRTPVDPAALMRDSAAGSRPRRLHRLFVALQAAACLAVIVGVVSLWRGDNGPQSLVENRSSAPALARADAGTMVNCMNGPAGLALGGDCQCVDLDADGDVDLADYGALQRSYAARR